MTDLIIDHEPKEPIYKVTLPCKPEEFTDFVSSLLSKGLTIEKNYNDIFELTASNIEQLYYLVTQRAAQNGGKLVSFNSKLYFSDKSSVSFNSSDDFFNHSEIKKIETKSLSMEMVYLIHFPDRPHQKNKQFQSNLNLGESLGVAESIFMRTKVKPHYRFIIRKKHGLMMS